ncbi:DUF2277 domain-containing protein [Candidatus Shapirobacteria bacterium]|nr:DUF2277 domain-containing protein [Candidatus Shapirobacteria bacterium]
MCRSIKPLFNYYPPATSDEIHDASVQFVKKISGFSKPSKINEAFYSNAINEIDKISQKLLCSLITNSEPKSREVENKKALDRALKRFG